MSEWKSLSRVRLCAAPRTIQSREFSRPEYWSGWSFRPLGDLSNPGIKPRTPTLQVDSLSAEPQGKPKNTGAGSYPFASGSSWPRNWTKVSCTVGGFFTSWAGILIICIITFLCICCHTDVLFCETLIQDFCSISCGATCFLFIVINFRTLYLFWIKLLVTAWVAGRT